MPLKHQTETLLVAVLGVAMVLAGVVVAVLSSLSSPGFWWIGAFLVSLAYPLFLYPLFRETRADYEFRLMHFLPALFLLVWLVLTILASSVPMFGFLRGILSFAWALPLVLVGFLLLAWFCLTVIRQWPRRLGMLMAMFLVFAALGTLGDRLHWNTQVAALIEGGASSGASSSASSRPIVVATTAVPGTQIGLGMAGSGSYQRPPHLPHAGLGLELFVVMVPAATSAAVHLKAMRRSRAA